MNVKPNIGTINALIRITTGLSFLAYCTAKMTKRPWRQSYWILAVCSAMKVAEGIVRYCPITALFENMQNNNQDQKHEKEQQTTNHQE